MGKSNPYKDFVSGGVGGVCLVVAGHPLDTIKVKSSTEQNGLLKKIKFRPSPVPLLS